MGQRKRFGRRSRSDNKCDHYGREGDEHRDTDNHQNDGFGRDIGICNAANGLSPRAAGLQWFQRIAAGRASHGLVGNLATAFGADSHSHFIHPFR